MHACTHTHMHTQTNTVHIIHTQNINVSMHKNIMYTCKHMHTLTCS